MPLTPIDDALRRIRRGEMVLVVDDEDRENEGDLDDGRGVGDPRSDQLHAALGARASCACRATRRGSTSSRSARWCAPGVAGCDTAFTVSIDHRNAGSGIGAADRALTIRKLLDAGSAAGALRPARARVPAARPRAAVCSSGAVTPKRPSTSPGSRGSRRSR